MEISPGVEIAWNLAGMETRATRMKEIEPDHFFCGLLKLSEMNEGELSPEQVPHLVIEALKYELDQLRKMLKEHSIDTTFVRREIRRSMEQGFLRIPEGEALHRSDASRQLFERATRAAINNRGVVDAPVLLRTLFARPTPAMIKVLGKTVEAEKEEKEAKEESGAVEIAENRFAHEMPALSAEQAQALPAATQPQVEVISWALHRASGKPICLICAGKVDMTALLQKSSQQEQPPIRILQVNASDLLKGARNPGIVLDRVGDLLGKAGKSNGHFVYFDTTALKIEKVALLLKSLKPFIEEAHARLVFAVQVGLFNQVIDDLQMDGMFQEIWLHELKEPRLPHQL